MVAVPGAAAEAWPADGPRAQPPLLIVVRVFKAELARSFKKFGRMDPWAVVERSTSEGQTFEVARTAPHKRGHKSPVWSHESKGWPFVGDQDELVEFHVLGVGLKAALRGTPTVCGSSQASVRELLGDRLFYGAAELAKAVPLSTSEVAEGPVHSLPLAKAKERTGRILVQGVVVRGDRGQAAGGLRSRSGAPTTLLGRLAMPPKSPSSAVSPSATCRSSGSRAKATTAAVRRRCGNLEEQLLTKVDPGAFRAPVPRIGTSGGTAPFFRLELLEGRCPGIERDRWIGKDLGHALREVDFYEQALALSSETGCTGFEGLLEFMVEYAGVANFEVEGGSGKNAGTETKDVLVMCNLKCGFECLRMLDIKIGERTAAPGWQGKSWVRAKKQDILDSLTNSVAEGFRLEGFDAPPPAFNSMNPLSDVKDIAAGKKLEKKARRFMFQRMPATEVFMHLADVHQVPGYPDAAQDAVWTPQEVAEVVLHEVCSRLCALALACRAVPVPQKWVGSSVAVGFDAAALPPRSLAEEEVRRRVVVKIFDWGRSELNTPERHRRLSDAEKKDRATFWRYYTGGVDRLAWEAVRSYHHRFGCTAGWKQVTITVYDFDSCSGNDFIGKVTVPLHETEGEVTMRLEGATGKQVRRCWGAPATLTYRVGRRTLLPEGSRIAEAWQVTVVSAAGLPGKDHFQGRSTSDPFVVLTAASEDGAISFKQQTCVVERQLNPQWNETFEFPVARDTHALSDALEKSAPGLGAGLRGSADDAPPSVLLPPDHALDDQVEEGMRLWTSALNKAHAARGPAAAAAALPPDWLEGSPASRGSREARPSLESAFTFGDYESSFTAQFSFRQATAPGRAPVGSRGGGGGPCADGEPRAGGAPGADSKSCVLTLSDAVGRGGAFSGCRPDPGANMARQETPNWA